MVDVEHIRKVATAERGKHALAELTSAPDDSLESVYFSKAAHVEDPDLYRIALHMGGDPIGNYENLGGTFKKQAFGTPMFQAQAAPDPMAQVAAAAAPGVKPPTPASTGAKPPSPTSSAGPTGTTGTTGGMGGPAASGAGGANPMQQPSTPTIPGATGQSAGAQ